MALFTQVLEVNLALGCLAHVAVFMIERNCLGHVVGFLGEARSLAGEELGKDWWLILLHKNVLLILLRLSNQE